MAIFISSICLPLEEDEQQAVEEALRLLHKPHGAHAAVVKSSPDLRRRDHPRFVYTVRVDLDEEEKEEETARAASSGQIVFKRTRPFAPIPGTVKLTSRPVIAGFGPAGMFAGLLLAQNGYRPLILERGADVDARVRAVESFWAGTGFDPMTNVQFGEGGAGTFSDGKLTTRINDPLCETVMDTFLRHGAPAGIRRLAKPHIGTDKLRAIVKSIREEILEKGGEIRFCTELTGVCVQNGKLSGITVRGGGAVECGALILAVGHSARDTFSMLLRSGVSLVPKPFSVGVRIEHLQSEIDKGLYGPLAGHPRLPKGEYQLSLRRGEEAVYTFCMCPGGSVVAAASEEGGVVTNGMSEYERGGVNANAAVAVAVGPFSSAPLAGVDFQRTLERQAFAAGRGEYRAPFQTVSAFQNGTDVFSLGRVSPSYCPGVAPARLDRIFPGQITDMLRLGLNAFEKRLPGFGAADAVLTGVETRTSSPVRIPRESSFEAVGAAGIYPAGEGAGYAGGIMSAAVDGLRVAGAIIESFAPLA